jgi:hypothetical protein
VVVDFGMLLNLWGAGRWENIYNIVINEYYFVA